MPVSHTSSWQPWFVLFVSMSLTLLESVFIHTVYIHRFWNICLFVSGHVLLSIMSSIFIYVVENDKISIFCMPHLYIYSCNKGHLNWFYILATVNNAVINMEVQVYLWHIDFITLDIYREVKLLSHVVILFLIFFRKFYWVCRRFLVWRNIICLVLLLLPVLWMTCPKTIIVSTNSILQFA